MALVGSRIALFGDECKFDELADHFDRAYGPIGEVIQMAHQKVKADPVNLIGIVGPKGFHWQRLSERTTNAANFSVWMLSDVLPEIPCQCFIVLDRLSAHLASFKYLTTEFERKDALLILNNPYCQDYNVIELLIDWLKDYVNAEEIWALYFRNPCEAIGLAISEVNMSGVTKQYIHGKYPFLFPSLPPKGRK